MEQLQYEPGSHFAAEQVGGPAFIGWGEDRHLAADIRDLLLATVSGLGGQKITAEDLYPRPKAEVAQEVATIADFNEVTFMGWLMS